MIDLFLLVILNSLAIVGFHIATERGMILHWVERLTITAPDWVQRPLWSCPYCMSSLHSLYFIVPYCIINQCTWWIIAPYILTLCGTTALTYNGISILRRNNP